MFSSFRSIIIDFYTQSCEFLMSSQSSFVSFSSQIIRQSSLIESLIVCDGIISAVKFTVDYICYKIRDNVLITKPNYDIHNEVLKRDLIKSYNSLYIVDIMDRYIMYGLVWSSYILFDWLVQNNNASNVYYYSCFLITLPYIQHQILSFRHIDLIYNNYKENKRIFVFYSLSKLIISKVQHLDTSIDQIQNYHIFILYKYLSFDMLLKFLKSYIFIYVLYFLRDSESTYYYYKAVKLAYYYSTGYLFNAITKNDSIYIINVIIKEKRWFDVDKLEIVHAFYRVITDKYNGNVSFKVTMELYIIKFCTLWSVMCLLKMLNIQIISVIFVIYLLVSEYINSIKDSSRLKRYVTGLLVYILLLLNINDLIISGVFVIHPVIYYIFEEIIFFIRNSGDIKKILDFYNSSDKQILKTYLKRVSSSKMQDNEYVFVTKS